LAVKCGHLGKDETRIKSGIAQHVFVESDFDFVKMRILHHFSEYIHLLGNILYACTEPPQRAMINLKQAYRQHNHPEATIQILLTKD